MMADMSVSVGAAYREGAVWSVEHPYYRAVADEVAERIHDIGVERGLAKATTRTMLMSVALNPEETFALSEAYPELTIVASGRARPGHAYWVAYRRAANEWLMEQSDVISRDVAHLGGSLTSYLLSGYGSEAKLLYDLNQPMAVHEKYITTMEAHSVFENYMTASGAIGRQIDHSVYDRYLARQGVRFHTDLAMTPRCEVLLLDLTMASYSPLQVASMMSQSGAKISMGFFVYHPSMLLSDEGEVGDTGVFFKRQASKLILTYPEGSAGVVDFGAHTWDSWLVSHSFPLGKGAGAKWFQLELMKNRGHLMFFRLVALDRVPDKLDIVHALDVSADESYVVTSWKLKRLAANPQLRASWQSHALVVSRRLVDRLYQFAMQLPKDQFTRYALRRQVSIINDRVTIEGTVVKVVKPLPIEVVDALVVAVYSRAFVDRYETTQLTMEAMKVVRSIEAFSKGSTIQKTGYIIMACLQSVYEHTLGSLDRALRMVSDSVTDSLSYELPKMEVGIDIMPSYMLVAEVARGVSLPTGVGTLVAMENSRLAASGSSGFGSRWARAFSALADKCPGDIYRRYHVEQVDLMQAAKAVGGTVEEALAAVRQEVALDEPGPERDAVDAAMVVRQVKADLRLDFQPVADPVEVLNYLHNAAFPGVAEQELEYDTSSLAFDPQDRFLAAERMVLSRDMASAPASRSYYRSKIRALNVPKRQQTYQELLSAIAGRNLNAPQISLPQDERAVVIEVWNNFLDTACLPGARVKLERYRADPVSLSEDAFREWVKQSTPDKLEALRSELEQSALGFSDMSVSDYLVMLKSDVKPPLSVKPLDQRTEPQVIVYHAKALSGLFSSIFRVLSRRFLSLIRPEFHVNLLKDTRDIEEFLRAIHPYGKRGLKYLENDFSKYDKSQGRFAFLLESYMFEQLGMNPDMLSKWLGGHVRCSMRAVSMMMRLDVHYQRKSGDATTSFGNVALNIMSTMYAYKSTEVAWALFMGDDSLVCCLGLQMNSDAVDVLAEVFNLGAKMFVTDSPYFASNFVFIDDVGEDVAMVADPVKRAERWSMSVSALDPQWHERYMSACDALRTYANAFNLPSLPKALLERYGVPLDVGKAVGPAIATVLADEIKFRNMWEEVPEISVY